MEKLSIQHNTMVLFRKIMGVFSLLLGVLYIVMVFIEPKAINIILAVMWTIMGSLYFLSSWESNRSAVEPGDGFIKLRWLIKLPLDFFETAQKKEVYMYFIELCRQKNLGLEKTGFGND